MPRFLLTGGGMNLYSVYWNLDHHFSFLLIYNWKGIQLERNFSYFKNLPLIPYYSGARGVQ